MRVIVGRFLSLLPVLFGLCLLSYAVNLFIFSMGRLTIGAPAIMPKGGFVNPDAYADPIPQALVLTAIVIGFGMTAFTAVLAIRARSESGTDHVDGIMDGEIGETAEYGDVTLV